MLEKPDLQDEEISARIRGEYGLPIQSIRFLPLGADINTAVYRLDCEDGKAYFVKLRRGAFNPASIRVPNFLRQAGIQQMIPTLQTKTGQDSASLGLFTIILYPFIEGTHAYENRLSPQQWAEFGAALRQIHSATIPSDITHTIPREDFSNRWREKLRAFMEQIETCAFDEAAALGLAGFLKTRKTEIHAIINRTEALARLLQTNLPNFVLCHADIHGWNLLVEPHGAFYIVDWDTLLFAPKERDLMFIGSGLGESGFTPQQEETLFYQGYGKTDVNPVALAYYRYERIIEDMVAYCEQLFLSNEGGADRQEALHNVISNFAPNGTLTMAYQADSD